MHNFKYKIMKKYCSDHQTSFKKGISKYATKPYIKSIKKYATKPPLIKSINKYATKPLDYDTGSISSKNLYTE